MLLDIDSKCANTPFFQQNMKHCLPVYNPLILAGIFLGFSALFLGVGGGALDSAKGTYWNELSYSNGESTFEVDLNEDAHFADSKPLLVYIKVDDFHQNIRSYTASYDQK